MFEWLLQTYHYFVKSLIDLEISDFSLCPLVWEPSFIIKFQSKFLGFHRCNKDLKVLSFYHYFLSKQFEIDTQFRTIIPKIWENFILLDWIFNEVINKIVFDGFQMTLTVPHTFDYVQLSWRSCHEVHHEWVLHLHHYHKWTKSLELNHNVHIMIFLLAYIVQNFFFVPPHFWCITHGLYHFYFPTDIPISQ